MQIARHRNLCVCDILLQLCKGEAGLGVKHEARLPTALSCSPGDLVYPASHKLKWGSPASDSEWEKVEFSCLRAVGT